MQQEFIFNGEQPVYKDVKIEKITRQNIEYSVGLLQSTTWEPRYNFHKYWGKKPSNLVGRYIEYFSKPGEIVLDPFCGSGVTIVEGAIQQRKSVGTDLNPVAVRMTNALLNPPSKKSFELAIKNLCEKFKPLQENLYSTSCRKCSSKAVLRSSGYKEESLIEVRYKCTSCGHSGADKPNDKDIQNSLLDWPILASPDAEIFYGWQMRKLKKANIKRWQDLFTKRNFFATSSIWLEIKKVSDPHIREWMLLSFTAGLAQFTKMIADFKGDAGGPSWKINCYWLPKESQELNPFWYFENRLKKSLLAVEDISQFSIDKNSKAILTDSRNLPFADNEVGYIFTDPPYGGEGIQYGELSMLWNLWLEEDYKLTKEVAFNPVRNLTNSDYTNGLSSIFSECYRVLKPNRWMTVTFANKDPEIWDALMTSCDQAGFQLKAVVPAKRSAPSLTETNMRSAPKSDLVLSFQKIEPRRQRIKAEDDTSSFTTIEEVILKHAVTLSTFSQKSLLQDLFDIVLIELFSSIYIDGAKFQPLSLTVDLIEKTLLNDPRFEISYEKKMPYFLFFDSSKNSSRSLSI